MAATRSAFRITSPPLSRTAFRPSALRQPLLRQARQQSTVAAEGAAAEAGQSQGTIARIMRSNVGPMTVHFWAPVMKWGVVLAGIADFARPAEQLSLSQNTALIATGLIWTRWCFIIKPRNVLLAAVNFFLFLVGSTQTTRILLYRQSLKSDSVGDELKDVAKDAEKTVEGVVKDVKGAAKKAEL